MKAVVVVLAAAEKNDVNATTNVKTCWMDRHIFDGPGGSNLLFLLQKGLDTYGKCACRCRWLRTSIEHVYRNYYNY